MYIPHVSRRGKQIAQRRSKRFSSVYSSLMVSERSFSATWKKKYIASILHRGIFGIYIYRNSLRRCVTSTPARESSQVYVLSRARSSALTQKIFPVRNYRIRSSKRDIYIFLAHNNSSSFFFFCPCVSNVSIKIFIQDSEVYIFS